MLTSKNQLIILLVLTIAILPVYAKDFGTQGHSYQITEQEFLQMIAERLNKIDVKKEQEKMQKVVRDRVPLVKMYKLLIYR